MKIDYATADKVLNNQASKEEAVEVLHWFKTDEGQFYLSEKISTESALLSLEQAEAWLNHPVPTDRMRNRFLKSMHQTGCRVRWQWVAAVVIPFFLLGGIFSFIVDRVGLFTPTEYAEIQVPCGEQLQVVLQDGTVIELNSDSKLRYPKVLGLFHRKVWLEGEGYFKVSKDKKRSFVIDLNGLNVEVTGTEFNVKAYPTDPAVYVTLDDGRVFLQDRRNREYPLVPGESAVYNRASESCHITKPADMGAITSWRNNSLNFYLTPLVEIIKVMERQYDTRFIVKDSTLLNNRFTLSTSKVNVVDVLRDLEKVSHIQFVQKGNRVFEVSVKKAH